RARSPSVSSPPPLHDALPIFHQRHPGMLLGFVSQHHQSVAGFDLKDVSGLLGKHNLAALPYSYSSENVLSFGWNLRTRFILIVRSEEHTSELQSRFDLVCRLL